MYKLVEYGYTRGAMLTYDFKRKVQIATYLIHKDVGKGMSIIKAVKLLFFADVYALRNYGGVMTGDVYYAMRNGPVPSEIDNIIEQNNVYIEDEGSLRYIKEFLRRDSVKGNTWDVVYTNREPDMDYLSEIDKKAIDYVYNELGACREKKLIDLSHEYKAWIEPSGSIDGENKREEMDMTKLFENDGVLAVDEKTLRGSQILYA